MNRRDAWRQPEPKRDLAAEVFSAIAPTYDATTRILSFGRDRAWKDCLVASLPDLPRPVCMDLACGTGDVAERLAARYPAGRIRAMDLLGAMLDRARRRVAATNVEWIQADLSRLPAPDASVDLVTGGYALRNAPDLVPTLRETARVLKPGGTAAFLDFSKPPQRFVQALEFALLWLWGGLWGLLLHARPSLYTYIAHSLAAFPDRRLLRELCARERLRVVASRRFFFGVTELLVLRKDD
jgi:demethylmenaquinone methyltransferase/2-methoxy-6-polyprenyl-1,4-benzoquinol methylase